MQVCIPSTGEVDAEGAEIIYFIPSLRPAWDRWDPVSKERGVEKGVNEGKRKDGRKGGKRKKALKKRGITEEKD